MACNLPFVDHVALMGLENTGFISTSGKPRKEPLAKNPLGPNWPTGGPAVAPLLSTELAGPFRMQLVTA
jgi:hypothetical protein